MLVSTSFAFLVLNVMGARDVLSTAYEDEVQAKVSDSLGVSKVHRVFNGRKRARTRKNGEGQGASTRRPNDGDLEKIRNMNWEVFFDNRSTVDETRKHEGMQSTPTWQYLQTKCLRQRYEIAAMQMQRFGCSRVLEVGGYTTPLTEAEHFKKGAVYVNVDPSVDATKVKREGDFVEMHLPVTLAEFLEATRVHKQPDVSILSEPFSCVLVLGAWYLHFRTEADQSAFKTVAGEADLVILESPESVHYQGLTIGTPILQSVGHHQADQLFVDCRTDEEAVKLAQWGPKQLHRRMKFFQSSTRNVLAVQKDAAQLLDESKLSDEMNSIWMWSIQVFSIFWCAVSVLLMVTTVASYWKGLGDNGFSIKKRLLFAKIAFVSGIFDVLACCLILHYSKYGMFDSKAPTMTLVAQSAFVLGPMMLLTAVSLAVSNRQVLQSDQKK